MAILTVSERQTAKFRCLYQIPCPKTLPNPNGLTAFNSPSEFVVSKVIAGWTWALQYMRVGERWMLYIPWQSGYGASGSSSGDIPGYTSLTFDVCLEGIAG